MKNVNSISAYSSSKNFNEFELSIKLSYDYEEEWDFIIRYFSNKINCTFIKDKNGLFLEYTLIIKKEYKYILNHMNRFTRYLNDYRTYEYGFVSARGAHVQNIKREFNSIEKSNNVMEILNYIDSITENG